MSFPFTRDQKMSRKKKKPSLKPHWDSYTKKTSKEKVFLKHLLSHKNSEKKKVNGKCGLFLPFLEVNSRKYIRTTQAKLYYYYYYCFYYFYIELYCIALGLSILLG